MLGFQPKHTRPIQSPQDPGLQSPQDMDPHCHFSGGLGDVDLCLTNKQVNLIWVIILKKREKKEKTKGKSSEKKKC